MGYHIRNITKGVLGHASKIQEELDELVDAEEQGNKILAAVELSDIYGALQAVASRYALTMDDLKAMSDATVRAFQSGDRGDPTPIHKGTSGDPVPNTASDNDSGGGSR